MNTLPIDIEALLRPISDEHPSGEDLTFSEFYDSIKAARRSDDATLDQGEWKTQPKQANWQQVEELAAEALASRSKDLQLAGWLAEALCHLHRFQGLEVGLKLIDHLIARFWDSLYPLLDDGDADARLSRLEWVSSQLATIVPAFPLAISEHRTFGWQDWKQAQELENLGRKDRAAMESALAEGKISNEMFQKAVAATPSDFYGMRLEEVQNCAAALRQLQQTVRAHFTDSPPRFGSLSTAIDNCLDLIMRIANERGLSLTTAAESPSEAAGIDLVTDETVQSRAAIRPLLGGAPLSVTGPRALQTRQDALRLLTEIAHFLRQTEPQSPVSYLVDRAVKWASMPLEKWLEEVVKEPRVLDELKETLGIKADHGE